MFHECFGLFFKLLWDKLRGRKKNTEALPLSSSSPSSSPTPWDSWELDPTFFRALSQWTLDHPESSLDRVLEYVCVGIDEGKEFLQLVPNSPFPARGLIGALAHLVKLGVTISKATKEVQTFAKEIVHWVGQVKSAFERGEGGRFTSITRKNLTEMRVLIDEICKWATARLEDGRWSRMGYALTIAKEINEFKSRIARARAIFMDISIISLTQGQDAIIRNVADLIMIIQQTRAQQLSSILDELEAQNVALDERRQAEARRRFLSRMLSPRTAAHTAYSDQGKNPCDVDTRVDVLTDIRKWITDISDGGQSFLWLTGDPGSGKSAITASIARDCKDNGILWAQFFINRNLGYTTNPASYFPSIARQLADHSSDVALAIHNTLKDRPSLMDDISQLQAGKLFVDSLKVASSTDPSKPVVVVIDGLDETDTTRLRYTAEILSRALVDLPGNAKVFISSRTEDDIRKPFSAIFLVSHVKHIHLDTSADTSVRDVSKYLERNISEIVERNDLDVEEWPGLERMRELCNQASGLFIWAVTVIKFIQDQVDTCGRECLNDLFDELNSKGMDDINELYGTILRLSHKNQTDPWVFERFRRIVGCIAILQQPLCLADITSLLNLRKTTSSKLVDIEHHVRRLRTVLVAGTDAINRQTVPRLHKSFFEFITSERADFRFRVNEDKSHAEVAQQCLYQLVRFSKKPGEKTVGAYFSSPVRYACQFWTSHIPSGMMAGGVIIGPLDLPELQEILQFPSHDSGQPSSIHVTFSSDKKEIISSSNDFIGLWDAESGAHMKFPLTGHTGAVMSVAFSPDGKQIVSGSWDNTLHLWDARSGQPIGSPFKDHSKSVNCAAFSPDGRQIVSSSWDNTLRLWNVQSGQPIRSPFRGHTNSVCSVAFSPNGKTMVSGSWDYTLRLWNVASGQPIGPPCKGHTKMVNCVAFSRDGKKIISGSLDCSLRLWDGRSGRPIGQPFGGRTGPVYSVAFSPNGKQIVSGSADKKLRLWDVRSLLPVRSSFRGHTNTVRSVAFSPDGKKIISGSLDCSLRLWDAQNGQAIGSPFEGHTGAVYSVAFSPDGKKIISGSEDNTLRLWDMAGRQTIKSPLRGHTDKVTCMALSPESRKIVSASLDDTVWVWDAYTGLPIGTALNCAITGVISLAFSPDGSQFAAASSGSTICLWDTESHSLLASYDKDCINKMSFITFSSDGRLLMTFSIDGTTYAWNATSGKPIENFKSSNIPMLGSSKPFGLGKELGWCHDEVDGGPVQWYTVDNPDFGHWAYIDHTFIRRDKTGLTTIMDMSEVLGNDMEVWADSEGIFDFSRPGANWK